MASRSLRPNVSMAQRRKSVIDETALLTGRVQRTVERLVSLWDQIDLPEVDRAARVATVYDEVYSLLDEMVAQEEHMVDSVREKKSEHQCRLVELCSALQLPVYEPKQCALYALVAELRDKNVELEAEIERRRTAASHMLERDKALAAQLHLAAFYLPDDDGAVPTLAQLQQLDNHVDNLHTLLTERECALRCGGDELNALLSRLGRAPCDDFERLVLAAASTPGAQSHSPQFTVSHENMQALEQLLTVVRAELAAYLADLRSRIESEYAELQQCYDKCNVPHSQRMLVDTDADSVLCESLVASVQSECGRWRAVYQRRRAIFDALDTWMAAWHDKLELDARLQHDSTLRANRGGVLDRALRRHKQLERRALPDARAALAAALADYAATHPGEVVEVHGHTSALAYVDAVVHEHKGQISHNAKADERKKKTVHEVRWGTAAGAGASCSSGKAAVSHGRSPSKTPSRQGKPVAAVAQAAKRPPTVSSAPQQHVAKRHCADAHTGHAAVTFTPSRMAHQGHGNAAAATPTAGNRTAVPRRAALHHTQHCAYGMDIQVVASPTRPANAEHRVRPDTPPHSRAEHYGKKQGAVAAGTPPDYRLFHTELEGRNGDHQSTSLEDGDSVPKEPAAASHLPRPNAAHRHYDHRALRD